MNRSLWFVYTFIICIGCYVKSFAAVQCPDLSISSNWKLHKEIITYQKQNWYIYKFWNDEPTRSGGELPVSTPVNDLITAQSIKFLDQLDQSTCRYEVTSNNTISKLVIKHMGSE